MAKNKNDIEISAANNSEVVTNCDHLLSIKYSPTLPYVFSEQGVAMLASVLHSETAVDVSVKIMDAFVAMRHFIASNAQVFQRLEVIEHHQLEMSSHLTKNDNQIAEIFKRLDKENATPTQGIFFDGQIFDAYTFVSDLIRSSRKSIVLFDNYVDDTVLTMLDYPEGELSTDELNLMQRRSVRPKYLPPSTPKRLSSSYRLTLRNTMHSTSPLT